MAASEMPTAVLQALVDKIAASHSTCRGGAAARERGWQP
jgi:hypothetical protein